MANLLLYSIFFIAFTTKDIWCYKVHSEKFTPSNRIVGGSETTITMYPYQASLSLGNGTHGVGCGGSIISDRYILTAAHCIKGELRGTVRIGSANKNDGGTIYRVKLLLLHPLYSTQSLDYDVGLVEIDGRMKLDGITTRAIRLAEFGNDPEEGQNLIITGWGLTAEGGHPSHILNAAVLPVVDRTRCQDVYSRWWIRISQRMLCAGYNEGGVGTCHGDSGGPVVLASNGVLTGIVAFSAACANRCTPNVYMRIGHPEIRSFIKTKADV